MNCKECLHIAVCSRYIATGGANKCKHFMGQKHGRWLPQILLGQRVWDCSECKTLGSPQWKVCPVCETKMDLPQITDQTKVAIEAMGKKSHGEEC